MQENNNFETIISKWRRISMEQIEQNASVIASMSSESNDQTSKKKEEESNLLVPEHSGHGPVAVMGAGVAAASELPSEQDGAGDTNDKKPDNCLANNEEETKSCQPSKEEMGDKTDSVCLRSPPPHKTQSAASTFEDEGCGMKCLYYTLQCCDCVLM